MRIPLEVVEESYPAFSVIEDYCYRRIDRNFIEGVRFRDRSETSDVGIVEESELQWW